MKIMQSNTPSMIDGIVPALRSEETMQGLPGPWADPVKENGMKRRLKDTKIQREVKNILARLESKNTQFTRSRKSKAFKQLAHEVNQVVTLTQMSQFSRGRTIIWGQITSEF